MLSTEVMNLRAWANRLHLKHLNYPENWRQRSPDKCAGCERAAKCCDFQPFLANFTLGAFIEKQGVEELRQLSRNHHLTPLGLIPSQAHRQRHESNAPKINDDQCVFFDLPSGRCRNWDYRPAECTTFSCTRENDEVVREMVFRFDMGLAQMSLVYQGFDNAQIAEWIESYNDPILARGLALDAQLEQVYLTSWNWMQNLKWEQVQEWLKP